MFAGMTCMKVRTLLSCACIIKDQSTWGAASIIAAWIRSPVGIASVSMRKYKGSIMQKKGISGITIIIILIATLLIAVISSLFIIQTGFTLEQKAVATSGRASHHLTNKLMIDEVGSSFDSNGYLRDFFLIAQPLPSSDRIDLLNLDLIVQTPNESVVLSYRVNGTMIEGNDGYNTWSTDEVGFVNRTVNFTLDVDYDDDGADDVVTMNNIGLLTIDFSSESSYTLDQVECIGADEMEFFDEEVQDDEIESILFKGYCGNGRLPENVTFTITPAKFGRGYYSLEYLQTQEPDHLDGKISKGDMVRIYFETLQDIGLNTEITLILNPSDGNPTEKRIYIPSEAVVGNIFFD